MGCVGRSPPRNEFSNTRPHGTIYAGTADAEDQDMAAVFALVFVPALAAALCMLGDVHGHLAVSTIAATMVFVSLLTGLLAGLFRLSRRWEDESLH